MLFFDEFSHAFPAFLLRMPFSFAASLVFTVLTYFPVGLAGEPSRRVQTSLLHTVLWCWLLCLGILDAAVLPFAIVASLM